MKRLWPLCVLCLCLSACQRQPGALPDLQPSRAAAVKPPTETSRIAVAAAADLKFALEEIVQQFRQSKPDIEVVVTYGASGNLYSQLSNGAPFDLFFSADMGFPRKLIEADLAFPESEFQYAVGHIGLLVLKDSKLDIEKQGMAVLKDPAVQKLAIANPKHAPYGRAAEAALKHFGLHEAIHDRLVLGENIAQATQFVEAGVVEIGIIAQSLASAPPLKDRVRFWPIPLDAYPKLEQGGVILKSTRARESCEALRSDVMSEPGQEILRRFGFDPPSSGVAARDVNSAAPGQ